jgi:hypothetical protein
MGIYYNMRVYDVRVQRPNPDPDAFNVYETVATIDSSHWTQANFVENLNQFLISKVAPLMPADRFNQLMHPNIDPQTGCESRDNVNPWFIELKSRCDDSYETANYPPAYGWAKWNYPDIVRAIACAKNYDSSI